MISSHDLAQYPISSIDQFIKDPHQTLKGSDDSFHSDSITLRTNYPRIMTKIPSLTWTAIDQLHDDGEKYLERLKTVALEPEFRHLIKQAHQSEENNNVFYPYDVKFELSKQLQSTKFNQLIEIYEKKLHHNMVVVILFSLPHPICVLCSQ
jgi:hypothetical protein